MSSSTCDYCDRIECRCNPSLLRELTAARQLISDRDDIIGELRAQLAKAESQRSVANGHLGMARKEAKRLTSEADSLRDLLRDGLAAVSGFGSAPLSAWRDRVRAVLGSHVPAAAPSSEG